MAWIVRNTLKMWPPWNMIGPNVSVAGCALKYALTMCSEWQANGLRLSTSTIVWNAGPVRRIVSPMP
jgi:hypothetical protein